MVKYLQNENKIVLFGESGAYGTSAGTAVWPGQVTSHSPSESQGREITRYAGTSDRTIAGFDNLGKTFGGTLTFFPQEFRILHYCLGQSTDAGSPSPFTHTYTVSQPDTSIPEIPGQRLPSFQIEDSHSVLIGGSGVNHLRTFDGCVVRDWTLGGANKDKLSFTLNYFSQDVSYASGASTAVTADTNRAFINSDVIWHFPSSGTTFDDVKSWSVGGNNGLIEEARTDNTRTMALPEPGNLDFSVNWTVSLDSSKAKDLYDKYFIGGSAFNLLFDATASTGSRELFLTMSGCRIVGMDDPTGFEGTQEVSISITPSTLSASETSLTQYAGFAGSF